MKISTRCRGENDWIPVRYINWLNLNTKCWKHVNEFPHRILEFDMLLGLDAKQRHNGLFVYFQQTCSPKTLQLGILEGFDVWALLLLESRKQEVKKINLEDLKKQIFNEGVEDEWSLL